MLKLLFKMMSLRKSRVRLRQIAWQPSLKAWGHLMSPGVAWIRFVTGKVSRSYAIQLSYFAKMCIPLYRRQGKKGLVIYLKTSLVLLMQSLPGTDIVNSSRAVGKIGVRRTHDGLPCIIPRLARDAIRKGDVVTIRLWLTLLGMYRVIEYIGNLKLDSIVKPGRKLRLRERKGWWDFLILRFLPLLEEEFGWVPYEMTREFAPRQHVDLVLKRYEPITSASADGAKLARRTPEGDPLPALYNTSYSGRFNAAVHWADGTWGPWLRRWSNLVYQPGMTSLWEDMLRSRDLGREAVEAAAKGKPFADVPISDGKVLGTKYHGRLAALQEAAGKVRVVALVDYWTQMALKPLHDVIFGILRKIPTDGTFDQLAPIKRLLSKVGQDQRIYSFDLSQATDRLSLKSQMLILAAMWSPRLAVAWRGLLVGRPYRIWTTKSSIKGLPNVSWEGRPGSSVGYASVRYAVGQPMGAYSSWAMLALTHHAMVQYSAYLEGKLGWFDLYAVLGDDIVIADTAVANRYRQICLLFGVEIGIAKSLVARNRTLEFAKRLFFRGEDVSGLPLKLWAAAQTSMSVASTLLAWYPHTSMSNFVRGLGVGYKGCASLDKTWEALPRRLRVLLVFLTFPQTECRFSFGDWASWLWSSGPNRCETTGKIPWKPLIERLMATWVTQAQDLIKAFKRKMFGRTISDPPAWGLIQHQMPLVHDAECSLNEWEGTLESAWWGKSMAKLSRVAELFETTHAWLSEIAALPPTARDSVWQDLKPERLFSIAKLYAFWASMRKVLHSWTSDSAKAERARQAQIERSGRDEGDDW